MRGLEPLGPFCQSCAMPLEKPEDFGTEKTGSRVNDFCRFCYKKGEFTDPKISMYAMIDTCVRVMVERKLMPEPQARALMLETIPKLKRWRDSASSQLVFAGANGK